MKINLELIREILETVEMELNASDAFSSGAKMFDSESDKYVVREHFRLMGKAGLLELDKKSDNTGEVCKALTLQGHAFLQKLRDDTIWNRLKTTAAEMASLVSLQVLVAKATEMISGKS